MSLLNKLFKKTEEKKSIKAKKASPVKKEPVKPEKPVKAKSKISEFKSDGILVSPITTEKAVSSQILNKYVFKVAPKANKIDIMKAVSKTHNVKVISANIVNIPRKARQVGKTKGFKSGYKKVIVTLAKGQSIEIK